MSVRELLTYAQHVAANGGLDFLVLIRDEDNEVYTIADIAMDAEHEALILVTDTRPLELRGR
jgi:hypothetical protein